MLSLNDMISAIPSLGLDVDNRTEFINEALFEYCSDRCIALTRSLLYRKNDQAWIEQKNIARDNVSTVRCRLGGWVSYVAAKRLRGVSVA